MSKVELSSKIIMRRAADLLPRPDNPRTHSRKQLKLISDSIRRFGFTNPVLIDADNRIVAGHARVEAAKQLGMQEVPTILLGHLTPAELKAYVITDNRSAELAGWDYELLSLNLEEIEKLDIDLDLTLTGFDAHEIEMVQARPGEKGGAAEKPVPEPDTRGPSTSELGDVWLIGNQHMLVHGDARDRNCYRTLLGGSRADLVITDCPWNLPIQGHVSGLGKARHDEFVMASGEMTRKEFRQFLADFMHQLSLATRSGSVHYLFIDWRHVADMIDIGETIYNQMLNLAVWAKTNGGMGSFYRAQHELVVIFRNGKRTHLNNIALGVNGRNRSNLWTYAGANTFGAQRAAELEMHPTVKPVAMLADAIKDASQPGDLVLDCFAGSGSLLMAAHETGRRARLIELAPVYVDVILRRAENAGLTTRLQASGEAFADVAARRTAERDAAAVLNAAALEPCNGL